MYYIDWHDKRQVHAICICDQPIWCNESFHWITLLSCSFTISKPPEAPVIAHRPSKLSLILHPKTLPPKQQEDREEEEKKAHYLESEHIKGYQFDQLKLILLLHLTLEEL